MVILFFKAIREAEADHEPTSDKMRRILESHVEEAETEEGGEKAERDLNAFTSAD